MKKQRNTIARGEIYKTSIFTAWLGFSSYMMLRVCDMQMSTNDSEFWSKLIALIGIIVATLIGWQIYSAMDWNSKAEKLNRIGGLEDKLNEACRKLIEQDERNLLLIRAINEIRKVTSHEDASIKYLCAAKAISLLLDTNVPIEDDLIDVQVEGLSVLLERMEKDNDVQARRLFAISVKSADKYYHQIISSINKKEGDLTNFRNRITNIRDRRRKFVEDNMTASPSETVTNTTMN